MKTPDTAVKQRLLDAGFGLVMCEPRMPLFGNYRPDVLAWASDEFGNLVPWALVEMKQKQDPHPALALQQLAALRSQLGTREHYVLINETEWFKADPGLQMLNKVAGPTPPCYGGRGILRDPELLTAMMQEHMWRTYEALRSIHGPRQHNDDALYAACTQTLPPELADSKIDIDKNTLWKAQRFAIERIQHRKEYGYAFGSQPTVADAIAGLLGKKLEGTIANPFCGTGSLLWSAIEAATTTDQSLEKAIGLEIVTNEVELARSVALNAPVTTTIRNANPLDTELPHVDCIVATPPLAMRLDKTYTLLDGSKTRDVELVSMDLCIRSLKPGGRAVLHLSKGLTYRKQSEDYRDYLANNLRVGALIGLPSGAFFGTKIPSVIIAIDNDCPSSTFVAQLGPDWQEQLSPSGSALQAAKDHLDGSQP